MSAIIKLRRDTAANWASTNPVLALGEPGYETDTGAMKIGDGTTAFNSLDYFEPGSGGASAGLTEIQSITPTGETADFTDIPQTFRSLMLYWSGMSHNDGSNRQFMIQPDCGAGFGNHRGNGNYILNPSSAGEFTDQDHLFIDLTQSAATVCTGHVLFPAYQSGPIKSYSGRVVAGTAGSIASGSRISFWGQIASTSNLPSTGAIVGLRAKPARSTGINFDGGTITLYGVN